MIVTAVVLADEPGDDPLTLLRGRPLLTHAVCHLLDSGLVEQVTVCCRPGQVSAVGAACAGLPVTVAADGLYRHQRAHPRTGDGRAEIVLLHDAARALAPPELAVAVVEAVRAGHGAALPVLPMSDTVKQLDPDRMVIGTPDRSTLCVVQTPQAIRRELLAGPPLQAVLRLAAADPAAVRTVPGHPLALAVRTPFDRELAELLAAPDAAADRS